MSKSAADIARERKWTVGTLLAYRFPDGCLASYEITAIGRRKALLWFHGLLEQGAWGPVDSDTDLAESTRIFGVLDDVALWRKVGHVDECAWCEHGRKRHVPAGCIDFADDYPPDAHECEARCKCEGFVEPDIATLARKLAAEGEETT